MKTPRQASVTVMGDPGQQVLLGAAATVSGSGSDRVREILELLISNTAATDRLVQFRDGVGGGYPVSYEVPALSSIRVNPPKNVFTGIVYMRVDGGGATLPVNVNALIDER